MTNDHLIFDRAAIRVHKTRAARVFAQHDFLFREMAMHMADRLPDVLRKFPLALELGARDGMLADYVQGLGGIETLVQMESCTAMIKNMRGIKCVADEELLPFAGNRFDLVMSSGALHLVGDLPGTLIQINHILKPDGMLLATFPGGRTLHELRESFEKAELAETGGISPRIAPFVDVKDAGALLQRAGFSLPVADSETITVMYDHPLKLLHDLRGMGEAGVLAARKKTFTGRKVMFAAMDYYQKHFADSEGRVPATFDIVTITGWKPHEK